MSDTRNSRGRLTRNWITIMMKINKGREQIIINNIYLNLD